MLVQPIIPTHLDTFLKRNTDTESRTIQIIEKVLEQLPNGGFDELSSKQFYGSISALEEQFQNLESSTLFFQNREVLENLLFGAYIVECLLNIRIHASVEARQAVRKAQLLFKNARSTLDKKLALESLGLIDTLTSELEERLSKIEPCIFSRRVLFD